MSAARVQPEDRVKAALLVEVLAMVTKATPVVALKSPVQVKVAFEPEPPSMVKFLPVMLKVPF